jgi:threonine dehydratase
MRLLMTRSKLVVEGAGAAATAAVLAGKTGTADGGLVVALVSGGNIDLSKLAGI